MRSSGLWVDFWGAREWRREDLCPIPTERGYEVLAYSLCDMSSLPRGVGED